MLVGERAELGAQQSVHCVGWHASGTRRVLCCAVPQNGTGPCCSTSAPCAACVSVCAAVRRSYSAVRSRSTQPHEYGRPAGSANRRVLRAGRAARREIGCAATHVRAGCASRTGQLVRRLPRSGTAEPHKLPAAVYATLRPPAAVRARCQCGATAAVSDVQSEPAVSPAEAQRRLSVSDSG